MRHQYSPSVQAISASRHAPVLAVVIMVHVAGCIWPIVTAIVPKVSLQMARSAPSPCCWMGCRELVQSNRYCPTHQSLSRQKADQQRGSAHERGYGKRWQAASKGFLRSHPLCARCSIATQVVPAQVVDHIIPHRGDMQVFWDRNNWQPLCKRCHDSKTAREDGGFGR